MLVLLMVRTCHFYSFGGGREDALHDIAQLSSHNKGIRPQKTVLSQILLCHVHKFNHTQFCLFVTQRGVCPGEHEALYKVDSLWLHRHSVISRRSLHRCATSHRLSGVQDHKQTEQTVDERLLFA